MRHFNLDALGRGADDDSGKFPVLVFGDLFAVANYKKSLALIFHSVLCFANIAVAPERLSSKTTVVFPVLAGGA